ncbi:hypothetical protein [Photobacterium lucens]|nr:hypothetical protein [Photobacterium lucens]MBP2699309.1 hypothetical protein [Vibrio parahaemolyticus]
MTFSLPNLKVTSEKPTNKKSKKKNIRTVTSAPSRRNASSALARSVL